MEDKAKKPKMTTKNKIIISILLIISILVGIMVGSYFYVRSKIYSGAETEEITTDPDYKEVPGITNVLLIGTDARDLDENARADSIIIATMDNNNNKLKLTSIMRDTLVEVPGHGEQKINAALALGGPELLLRTIKENFNLALDKYVIVNFWGFEDIVDRIGGIDIDVKDYEIPEINKFIGEVREEKSPPLKEPGLQTLDGQQALAYARIRKVGNGGYERTQRQRLVLDTMAKKMMDVSVLSYPGILYDLLPSVRTNIEPFMLLNYAYTVSKFGEIKFEQLQIPANELSWSGLYTNKGWVLLADREQNGKVMNDFIFNNIPYSPSNVSYSGFKKVLEGYLAKNEEYQKLHGELPKVDENHEETGKDKVEEDNKDKVEEEKKVEVPNLIGKSSSEAIALLESLGLKYTIEEKELEESKKGIVVSQSVSDGSKVDKGSSIVITVGKYTPVVDPPPGGGDGDGGGETPSN